MDDTASLEDYKRREDGDIDVEKGRAYHGDEKRRCSDSTSLHADDNIGTETTSSQEPPADHAPSTCKDQDPPPDGGVRAWMQVVSGFMLYFNSWYSPTSHAGARNNMY